MGISILLLLVTIPQADASIVGDMMHIKAVDEKGLTCEFDVLVVDPGAEIIDCFGIDIDVNANSIWFLPRQASPDGTLRAAATFEFTDMDWVNNPNGKIVGVTVIPPFNAPVMPVSFDAHSIFLSQPEFNLDCMGNAVCRGDWHIEFFTVHAIGGEISPTTTSALLLAGSQNMMSWMIPVIVSVIGIGIVIARKF